MHYFVFDLLIYDGRDFTRLPLIERREIMRVVLKSRSSRIRISDYVEASATDMLHPVRERQSRTIRVCRRRTSECGEPAHGTRPWLLALAHGIIVALHLAQDGMPDLLLLLPRCRGKTGAKK